MEDKINNIINLIKQNKPKHLIEKIDKTSGGLGVLMYLESHDDVKITDITKHLEVTSARMAVLLEKMKSKNLIIKEESKVDARITKIRLSENGKKLALQYKKEHHDKIKLLINEIGYEKLINLFETISDINNIIEREKGYYDKNI